MKRRTVFIGWLALVLGIGFASAQQSALDHYKWSSRLVLILSENLEDPMVLDQMKEFEGIEDELLDRKLLLIHVQSDDYTFLNVDLHDNLSISFSSFFEEQMKGEESFKLLLIGLDGDIKLESHEVVKSSHLFRLIDSMPMRRAELRNKKRGQ